MQPDANKETIGSLGVIRQMLDHARTADEAVNIMKSYNIDFDGGPFIHYLIADATGKSILGERCRIQGVEKGVESCQSFVTTQTTHNPRPP
jgi:penicillin V acylase-like amidase (Ntn superfamily)